MTEEELPRSLLSAIQRMTETLGRAVLTLPEIFEFCRCEVQDLDR